MFTSTVIKAAKSAKNVDFSVCIYIAIQRHTEKPSSNL